MAGTRVAVHGFELGPWATNCYVVAETVSRDADGRFPCWIVDASFEPRSMLEYVGKQELKPEALIFTHAHIDHIAGAFEVRGAFPALPVMIHEQEERWLNDPELNLSAAAGIPVTAPAATRVLHDGETLTLGATTWRVLHVPGHSPGSVALWCESEGALLGGDALFAGSIGRTDFPGCSFEQLERSIRTKLYTLPDTTIVYPGHGPATTIGREKRSNPFVRP
jgi:hydroxyacylglutathione hydrolase